MDSSIRVVLVQVDYEPACRHRYFFSRHTLPGVALRLLLLSLLCTLRAADLYLALDQKQRLVFLSSFDLSARACRIPACHVYHRWTAGGFAAHPDGARSALGSTRSRCVFSGPGRLIHTRPSLAIFRAHLFLL